VMGAALLAAQNIRPLNLEVSPLPSKALYVLVLFLLAAGIYGGLTAAMGARELYTVLDIFRRKRR